jgi:argininosuccinate lyase
MAENSKPIVDLEHELSELTKTPERGGNGGRPPATNAVMTMCLQAADLIRAIPVKEINTGEDVAKQLEEIGETFAKRLNAFGVEFRDTCHQAAEELRKLRAVPKEQAEQTADDLIRIGKAEAERHAGVTTGLMDMRGALDRIANIDKIVEQLKGEAR